MAQLVSVAAFRSWAGAGVATVPDELVQSCLDEAEAGIEADLDITVAVIQAHAGATFLATGEEMRRASRLLARRHSPEAVTGVGEAAFAVPSRDPDSDRTLNAIRALLLIPEGVA